MRITVLASGSGGNAALFEVGETRLLVDAGIGWQTIKERLCETGTLGMPTAILVTHAHLDHLGNAVRIARKRKLPLYLSEATARVTRTDSVPEVFLFGAREPFSVGELLVSPMPLPHDVAQVALRIEGGGRSAALATDLGEVPPGLPAHFRGCDVLLLESNHDPEMLAAGPYPAHLKRRIGSARGHLSNQQTHALLRALPPRAHTVVLMHLSQTNNREALALEMARDALTGRRARLFAASQSTPLSIDAGAAAPPLAPHRGPPKQLELPLC